MSRNGVHCGLRLPVNIDATSHARWPTVWPAASTTYHFLFPARSLPLGKYVDIVNYLYFKRLERERLEYRSLLSIVKPTILHSSGSFTCHVVGHSQCLAVEIILAQAGC